MEKPLVVKSNRLIEAAYRLSLTEQRIILFSICQARETQTGLFPDLPCVISIKTFAKQFGLDETSAYAQVRDALDSLYLRTIKITEVDEKTGALVRKSDARWIWEKGETFRSGTVDISFTPRVIPFLTRLESEFTAYRLEKIGKMSSVHAIRLYELLVQYLPIGSRTMAVSELREMIGIENEYKMAGDFKKWVVDVGVEQINHFSDLTITYKVVKTSRAITGFVFKIRSKDAAQKKKKIVVNDKTANPGESYAAAKKRLQLEAAGQENLL